MAHTHDGHLRGNRIDVGGVDDISRAHLERPLHHRLGDRIGKARVERVAVLEGGLKFLEHVLGEAFFLHGDVEDVGAEGGVLEGGAPWQQAVAREHVADARIAFARRFAVVLGQARGPFLVKLGDRTLPFNNLVERRTAELNGDQGGPSLRQRESMAPTALVCATPTPPTGAASKTAITLLFDTRVLALIDADAKRLGIGRTARLHVAAGEWLDGRR